MSDDTMLRDRLRKATATEVPPSNILQVTRRTRILRARRVSGAIAAAVLAAAAIAYPLAQLSRLGEAKKPANDAVHVVRFEQHPSWNTISFPADDLFLPTAWAANVPFAPEDVAGESPTLGYPDATIESLPPGGIVLRASVVVESRNEMPDDPQFPNVALSFENPMTNFEGQRPGTSMAIANATVGGRFVSVTAVFGDERVSKDMLRAANDELDRLLVAPAPTPTRDLNDVGIRMQVPDSWDRFLSGGDEAHLQTGTMPITDLYTSAPSRKRMGPDDVMIVLSESGAVQDRFEPVQLPIGLRFEDECPTCEILDGGEAPPVDHTLLARTFSVGDRRFLLYAEFGAPRVTGDQLQVLNDVLATLEIHATGSLEPSDPGATPQVLPPGPALTATESTPFTYQGISVEVPTGWSAGSALLDEPAPAPVVAGFGSWPFPSGGGCGPEPALAALPADGAFVWIVEHPSPGNRGDYYRSLRYTFDGTTQPMRWECGYSAPSLMELWELGGRYLEVHVALGPDASAERIEEVVTLLNSLDVGTRG